MKSINVNDSNIDSIISVDGLTILDFWAPWCGPCKTLGPIVEQLATNNPDVTIGKVNVDENNKSALEYGIRSIPTVLIFKDGEKIDKFSGVKSLSDLQKLIDENK